MASMLWTVRDGEKMTKASRLGNRLGDCRDRGG